MTMKRSVALLVSCNLLLLSTGVSSHDGGLDRLGCHHHRKAGGYHCHRGALANQSFISQTEAYIALNQSASPGDNGYEAVKEAVISGVATVIDGDTLEIHARRIRLHAVDAPESAQICRRDSKPWRCGSHAANQLSDWIAGRTITCTKSDIDRYQRIVAVCRVGSDDVGGWLVRNGLALAYLKYGNDYVPQEGQARSAGKGLWGPNVIFQQPWEWRQTKRK